MIKKIYVFDFDGCLINSPLPEQGKIAWSKYYGKEYPFAGWWGRLESLDNKVFKITPKQSIVREYVARRTEKDAVTIMLTSRLPKFENVIMELLFKFGIKMDEYLFKKGNLNKSDRIDNLIKKYPTAEYIEIWDDNSGEIGLYEEWAKHIDNIEIKINKVE